MITFNIAYLKSWSKFPGAKDLKVANNVLFLTSIE